MSMAPIGVSWQKVETCGKSPPVSHDTAVGGAVPCVVGNRIYLVGGSGTDTNHPDIALHLYAWSSSIYPSRTVLGAQQLQQSCNGAENHPTAAVDEPPANNAAAAAADASAGTSSSPVLIRMTASQEGDIPLARIGHAAVTIVNTSIFLFGGEAAIPVPAIDCSPGSLRCPKLGDIYEAIPKSTCGTLVWRALSSQEASTTTDEIGPSGGDGGVATTESGVVPIAPSPMSFHAFCAISVPDSWRESGNPGDSSSGVERAMLIHGGIDQSSELLGDLWAFFPSRLPKRHPGGKGERGVGVGSESNSDDSSRTTGWERLIPEGEGPPPAAYHSATPVNDGWKVVFIGGGKSWRPSTVFLLDTIGLMWSSFEAAGGVGLSEQRYLHTAISVMGVETEDRDDNGQQQRKQHLGEVLKQATSAAVLDAAPSPPNQGENSDPVAAAAAVPALQLWGPVTMTVPPGSARPVGPENGAVAAAAAKKKGGPKEGGAGSKKSSTKETVNNGSSRYSSGGQHLEGQGPDGGVGNIENGVPPVFECILIFGGIVGEKAVSGDATVLRHDGTVVPLCDTRNYFPAPGPRYSHAMVSVTVGDRDVDINGSNSNSSGSSRRSLVFLFGGCRGDGTRVAQGEPLVLSLTKGGGGVAGGGDGKGSGLVDEEGVGRGVGNEDLQLDTTKMFDGGDVYTGQLDADGRRQGRGRCEYGAAEETAISGVGVGGSYSGDWDADKPHGRGERLYVAPRGAARGARGVKEWGGGAATDEDENTAIVIAAFGPGCPPMASYKGDFKRGIRDGNGVCFFFAPGAAAAGTAGCAPASGGGIGGRGGRGGSAAKGGALGSTTTPTFLESYDGQWVGGRPLGRGILSLRAVAVGTTAPAASSRFPSLADGARRSGCGGGSSGGSIEGVWTEEGLVYGREKLPGNGGVYEGQYRLGKRDGHGRLDLPNGSEYEGAWRNGRPNGIGTFRCGVSRHVFTGKWVGGVRCGRGVCEYASGSRYDGLWLNGLRHGQGVLSPSPGGGDCLAGLWHRDEFKLESSAASSGACYRPSKEKQLNEENLEPMT